MKEISIELFPHYSIENFICVVCGLRGIGNWQPKDGEIWKCPYCAAEYEVSIRLKLRTKHVKRKRIKKAATSILSNRR